MKKYLIYSFIAIALFASCKKGVDPAPGERPEERIAAALKTYDNALTGAPNGWKAYLYPAGGSGYSFYMTFNTSNRVSMYADINNVSTQTSAESSYSLKAILGPSLLFDTYNYIHLLADPAPEVNGGTAGSGFYSDFEFTFDRISGDSIILHGNRLNSPLILIKATAAEAASYKAKNLNTLFNSVTNYVNKNNLYLQLGDNTKIQTSLNFVTKILSLNWFKNGTVSQSSSAFAFTLTGVILKQPVIYEGKKITELTWDAAAKQLYVIIGGVKFIVQTSPTPVLPLHLLIGVSYNNIIVPSAVSYAGWGPDFVARRYAVTQTFKTTGYGFILDKMQFTFNVPSNSMTLTVYVIYSGIYSLPCTFSYTFTKTTDGVYKFDAGQTGGYADFIKPDIEPITKQRIGVDHFTLDYFFDTSTGQVLGQFKSVENPDFTFTGTLNQ